MESGKGSRQGKGSEEQGTGLGEGKTLKHKASVEAVGSNKEGRNGEQE